MYSSNSFDIVGMQAATIPKSTSSCEMRSPVVAESNCWISASFKNMIRILTWDISQIMSSFDESLKTDT
jgi:hypothetical protein